MSHSSHMCHFVSLHISQDIALLTMVNKPQNINSPVGEIRSELDTNQSAFYRTETPVTKSAKV